MATTVNLGKVMVTPKGTYSPTTSYEWLDIVTYGGSSYVVLQDVIGVTPTEGEYYTLIASKGDRGATGAQGDTGDPPTLTSQVIEYQIGSSGTTVPTGAWTEAFPTVSQGDFVWVRTTLTFENSNPIVIYSTTYEGRDGSGVASNTAALALASTASAGTSSELSRADHVHPYPTPANIGAVPTTRTVNGNPLSANVTITASSIGAAEVLKFTSFAAPASPTNSKHSSDTNSIYPYRYSIVCSGVTAAMYPEVTFGVASAISGNYSPLAECYAGGVYIWSKVQTAPTILSILVHK